MYRCYVKSYKTCTVLFPSAYSFTNKPSNNPLFSQTFCLTKAYNLYHQVTLVEGPMRREVAIRWTNRTRGGAVWACATQMNQCTEFAVASDDDSDVR